jgi:zinc protease
VSEIFTEIRGIVEKPPTQEELRMAKDALSRSIPARFETSDDAASSFGDLFVYDLSPDYYSKYPERIEEVTVDQTLAAARKYLSPDKLMVVAVGDRSKIEPTLRTLMLGPVEAWTRR